MQLLLDVELRTVFPHSVFITNEYKYEAKKYAHDIHWHGNHCHGNHCHDNQLIVRGMILSANISQLNHTSQYTQSLRSLESWHLCEDHAAM